MTWYATRLVVHVQTEMDFKSILRQSQFASNLTELAEKAN